jgi:hypothetical protein
MKSAVLPFPAASRQCVITFSPGSTFYRGVGDDKLQPHTVSFDGCLWLAESPTIARSYIPISGLKTLVTLECLCSPPGKFDSLGEIQSQLGFAFRDVQHGSDGRPKSYIYPSVYDQLVEGLQYPTRPTPTTDEYYTALFAFQAEQKRRAAQWMLARLADWGYKPEDGRNNPWFKLKTTTRDGKHLLLKNENQPGTLFTFEAIVPLRIFDMTEGGRKDGDLMDLDCWKIGKFEQLAANGFDGVKINDFAQVSGHGNVGHRSIGLFSGAVQKIREIGREVSTHPVDFWADIDAEQAKGIALAA